MFMHFLKRHLCLAGIVSGLCLGFFVVWMWVQSLNASTPVPQPSASFQVTPSFFEALPVPMPVISSGTFAETIGQSEGTPALLSKLSLDESWLVAHGFAPTSIARAKLFALLDGRALVDSRGAERLAFGPVSEAKAGSVGIPRLSPHERYIQAGWVPSSTSSDDSVLVRWSQSGSDSVIDLSAQALNSANGEALQLWRHTEQDWTPGRYQVEVLSANPALDVLAYGEFDVVASGAAVTPFAKAIVPISLP